MHLRTQRFSLIGRKVLILGVTPATILEKDPDKMNFLTEYGWILRANFVLPRDPVRPVFLPDNYQGFVYEGVEGF